MHRTHRALSLFTASLWFAAAAIGATVGHLRVEYLDRPLGVDVARPRLGWVVYSDERAQRQTAYQVLVASSEEKLAAGTGDIWDTAKVSSPANFGIEYSGPELKGDERYFWKVRCWDGEDRASPWSEPSSWQMGLVSPADWHAKWIGGDDSSDSPLLRRAFHLDKPVARATAYVYAAGWYRLFLNGSEVDGRVLSPVNSNYSKALFYDSHDVTPLVQPGKNAVGMWLGRGYDTGYSKYGFRWDVPPAALVQLEVVFHDGTRQTIVSDAEWKWTGSPILDNSIYHGETYDARRDIDGWSRADFDDRGWRAVALREVHGGPLKSCPFPGLAVAANLHPVKVTEPNPGVFIFDLGQNIAGWVRLNARGAAGTKIVLRHAEDLHPDGTLDPTTNRAARATDTFILRGQGEEIYEPRFTYHGFRYVEVTGYPGTPTLENLSGRSVHATLDDAGSFECSDPLLNRMHRNFRWSIANNLMGIPTDTATRDERTPCQMDSLAVEDAAICNFGMAPYYSKWLHDIAGDGGSLPNWTGDQVVLPYLLHESYGDRRILEEHFENMKQVVDRFEAVAEAQDFWANGFGDWAAPNVSGSYEGSFSEGELVNTAFHHRAARIVAQTAAILGHEDDARRYTKLAEAIRESFFKKFHHRETATFGSGRQVTSVLPLAFDMVAPEDRPAVASALRRRIEEVDRSHLDTGIFGTRYLFEVLIDHGFADLALSILTNSGYPGYADQIAQGATTTWEQWSYSGSMQTHDHAMFAGPDATFFTRLGGIRPASPGFREITIRPAMPSALSFVNCARQTPVGEVSCNWVRTGDRLVMRVGIPVSSTAHVFIPAAGAGHILESGRPVAGAPGVLGIREEAGCTVITVGSGNYEFIAMQPGN